MKVLKNNSLINLQHGIELVVQSLHRNYLGENVRFTSWTSIVFAWTKKQVNQSFSHVIITFKIVLIDIFTQ